MILEIDREQFKKKSINWIIDKCGIETVRVDKVGENVYWSKGGTKVPRPDRPPKSNSALIPILKKHFDIEIILRELN